MKIKNAISLLLLLISSSSCVMAADSICQSINTNKSISTKTKKFLCGDSASTGLGAKHYKYKCKKAGDCCEIGKNCEEDKQKKETKE